MIFDTARGKTRSTFQRESLILPGLLSGARGARSGSCVSPPRLRFVPCASEELRLGPSRIRRVADVPKIGGITDLSTTFPRLMRHPDICGAAPRHRGRQRQLCRDVVMVKPAFVGRKPGTGRGMAVAALNLVSAAAALGAPTGPTAACKSCASHDRELNGATSRPTGLKARRASAARAGGALLFQACSSCLRPTARIRIAAWSSSATRRRSMHGGVRPGATPLVRGRFVQFDVLGNAISGAPRRAQLEPTGCVAGRMAVDAGCQPLSGFDPGSLGGPRAV
jgi:hypothetical protein